ncbi:nucleoside triphosphate pyrophosphohydrolase [Cellulosilyticum sp. WCF-2]|uniref:nucleoside triphosphate pyrophosphohydrolase n=1 Tax=Cellulosilyticum sp. WCF-2 TaxID=2497860 RepID=UPI000F8F390F|nr:nucleoside triphosphate pyrophosphohydrolase [Cellulosilyticum sp. WCF-2]QEH68379.1 nucleoside triphosphate pyrophosphohydrolase [Cellulosilyticum sp. WCF-2]
MESLYSYEDLVAIIEKLRGEGGCPWDREQTHESLIPCLLEESYELMEALQNNDIPLMREELGDVLLQVLMHTQIAKEDGEFTLEEVIHDLAHKLIYRHPHVFKDTKVENSEEVLANWEELKQKEKNETSLVESMDRVAKTLPALVKTQKVQKKAIKSGAINRDILQELEGLIDRLNCIKDTVKQGDIVQNEEKIGEILFAVVKLSTFFEINAEFALTKSMEKFINRFRYIENSRVPKD